MLGKEYNPGSIYCKKSSLCLAEEKKGMLFKNIIISILAVIAMSLFSPILGTFQAVVTPIIWYFIIAGTLTWLDLQRLARKEREKNASENPENKK